MSDLNGKIPCSPKDEVDGVLYFARLCDKVRLMDAGQLHEDYHANLGVAMDLWTCQFLGVSYEDLAEQIRSGKDDGECMAWARANGVKRPEYELQWWKSYMLNKGFRDDLSERLAQRNAQAGFGNREDILTFMDYIDADEGRA